MVLEKAMAKRAMIRNTGKTVLQLPKKGTSIISLP
jgi:hypothetical protein